ncbi:MAG: hypothetical protein IK081_06270 [Lachnospiraceae bacterium]|nr:hypothetical protein [Lachnospiraceae bacterium]
MKYNAEEGFEEIKKRGSKIRKRHEQRVRRILYGSTAILAIALFGVLGRFAGTSAEGTQTVYGAFLLSAESGGYILTALLAFFVGVLGALSVTHGRIKDGGEKKE